MKKIILSVLVLVMTAGFSVAAGVIDVPAFPIGNEIGTMLNTSGPIR